MHTPARTKTRSMVLTAAMTAVLAITAQIIIPNPFGPVPFSLSIFGVALVGSMLSPKETLASIGVYLLLGMVGLPVFAGFNGGPQVLVGPTGGFLAGYFLLGLSASFPSRQKLPLPARTGMAIAGLLACYLLGLIWFSFITKSSFISGFMICVAPFIIPDIIKIGLAVSLAATLQKQLKLGSVSL